MADAPSSGGSEKALETVVILFVIGALFVAVSGVLGRFGVGGEAKALRQFDSISTLSDISVLDRPAGGVLGTQPRGAIGIITDGPEVVDGIRYWFVDFGSGPDGWVDERGIGKNPDSLAVGDRVAAKSGTGVYSEPAFGFLGSVPAGTAGTVVRGPAVAEETTWWYIDFDEGHPDGWVRAGDLVSNEQETPTGLADRLFGERLRAAWSIFVAASTLVSLLLITGIVYTVIRLNQLVKELNERFATYPKEELEEKEEANRWRRIKELAGSESPNDWRAAIIEADIMLGEILEKAGYPGDSVGERLKRVEPGFVKLNEAWEAHKMRNEIAHSGSDFILTKRDSRRVIDLYEQVFKEFYFL